MEEFLSGLFVFVIISILFGLVDAVFPIMADDTILTLAAVLGLATAGYGLYKRSMA